MDFIEFLNSKKIDPIRFKELDLNIYNQWQELYTQVHPESFVAQKKFLINPIRRKYPLLNQV